MAKANMEMIEAVVSRITDKLVEAMMQMTKELAKCVTEMFLTKIIALETPIMAIEESVAEVVTRMIVELEK